MGAECLDECRPYSRTSLGDRPLRIAWILSSGCVQRLTRRQEPLVPSIRLVWDQVDREVVRAPFSGPSPSNHHDTGLLPWALRSWSRGCSTSGISSSTGVAGRAGVVVQADLVRPVVRDHGRHGHMDDDTDVDWPPDARHAHRPLAGASAVDVVLVPTGWRIQALGRCVRSRATSKRPDPRRAIQRGHDETSNQQVGQHLDPAIDQGSHSGARTPGTTVMTGTTTPTASAAARPTIPRGNLLGSSSIAPRPLSLGWRMIVCRARHAVADLPERDRSHPRPRRWSRSPE